ncbi:MAG TPA: hypothetical protein VLR89_10495, partial [Anaerolineaceae bacterium]|nr:hypothetical protein [Anaerolineaceae bacterium]
MKMLRGLMKVTRYSLWLLAFLLVAMAAIAALLPSYPSQAKYVLNPVTVNINLASYETIPLTSVTISGTTQVGQTLSASLAPSGATATYQWTRSLTSDGVYEAISGAVADTYLLTAGDFAYYFKVQATGTGSYSGTVSSAPFGPIGLIPLTSVSISGTPQVGQTLTAVNLTPSGASASYQWQWSTTQNGTFTDISGANFESYSLTAADYPYWIRVQATGTGSYSGTVYSTAVGPVAPRIISISAISGVTIPSAGASASTSISSNGEYTGTITWSPALVSGIFASNTVYTATITITPNTGYTLTGVPANFFTVAGATSVSNAADSGIIT